MDKPQIYVHIEKAVNYNVFDVKWMPKSAKVVALGNHTKGTGALQIYEMNKGELQLVQDIERPKPLKCGTFSATSFESRSIALGDFDGNLEIIDFLSPNNPIYSVKAHTEIINSIDGVAGLNVGKGAPEIVTGSRDGFVKIWDPRQKERPVVEIEPLNEKEKRDCWTVSFGNSHTIEDRVVCAGFDNGDIKMFDLRSVKICWESNLKNGVCSIEFDRKDNEMNKLIATTLESKFYIFDLRTFHSEKGYSSLMEKYNKPTTVWCVKHLPQNREICITTSGSGSLDLWKYSYPPSRVKVLNDKTKVGVVGNIGLVQNATLSSQPITGFDWNMEKQGLCVCSSLDQSIRVVIVTKLNNL